MAMTIQQAQLAAMQLRAKRPELQNMAVGDLVAQIMASEGEGQPGAGGGGLANLFATPLSPASPAPMEAARLVAPKPTAQMFPAANASKAPNPLSWMGANPSSGYGAKRPTGSHQGIDYPVPKGTPIGTPAPGVVEVAKSDPINGNYVVVRHPNGQSTSYSHLDGIGVEPGQSVNAGDVLGTSGNTGRVRGKNGGYHLHLGARDEKNNRIDPRRILKDPSVLGVAREGTDPVRTAAVAAAAPQAVAVAAPTGETMAAPKGEPSRFRPMFEQKQAELQQLKASIPAGKEPSAEQASQLRTLSGVVSQLKGLVAAEEGAVVNAERAALLERQKSRLGREEELIERTRKLAPGNALIAFGNALAGAKPGEKFASALARGLQAGSESYTGARDAREASLRGIEEKRDDLILKNRELIEKARADAINLINSGATVTEGEMRLANLNQEGVNNLAEAPFKLKKLKAEATEATVKADNAQAVINAGLEESRSRTISNLRPPASGGGSGGYTPSQLFNRANTSRVQLKELEEKIIEADENGDYVNAEQMLRQYGVQRDVYNQNAVAAGLAPVTIRGFPVNLPGYEAYVKRNKRHPSGKTYVMPGQGGGGSTGTIVSSKPIK